MGYFNVDMISDDIVNKFTILKGQRENLEKQIQLRMKALMIAAYGEWERQANAYFSVKSNATRYLEGLYLDLSDDSEPIVSLKDGTLGSMLEGGYGAFDRSWVLLVAPGRFGPVVLVHTVSCGVVWAAILR